MYNQEFNKSQFGQDIHLAEKIYKHKKNGFFVEIGAYDGVDMSNTYLLENKYEWKGLCVECNPFWYSKLIQNRPNCYTSNYAIFNEDDKILPFINDDTGGCSGFFETNSHTHILNKPIIDVTTKKLTTILDMYNAPNFIEFLSIDTEGSEYEILNAHDFNKYIFGYICVEHNYIEENRKKIRQLLQCKGYIFYRENQVDDDYIHHSLITTMNKKINTNIRRGIFYNSKKSMCSIWESGKMCYDALKKSHKYILDYSEEQSLDFSYDFVIINDHHVVNKWMNENMIKEFNKPVFCIVTEVSFSLDPLEFIPKYYTHYIVLDPTIQETDKIFGFGRPIEDFDLSNIDNTVINYDVPTIFSFGFSTEGKEWHKIVELVQNEYDFADIHFNIPQGTYIPDNMYSNQMNKIIENCKSVLKKEGIRLKITSDNLSKEELIRICSTKTINCFFYNREHIFPTGLAAVTDQAIASGRPLFITSDRTFRHLHKYIDCYPEITIKEAIEKTQNGVLKMKEDWSCSNFLNKFEKILFTI
jgi:FkbM family methyltransferase